MEDATATSGVADEPALPDVDCKYSFKLNISFS